MNFVFAEGWPGNLVIDKRPDEFRLLLFFYVCWAVIIPAYVNYMPTDRLNPLGFVFKPNVCHENKIYLVGARVNRRN